MVEMVVHFQYAGARCKMRLTERDAGRALAQARRLLALVKAETPGETLSMCGCCPTCGAVGVQFEYAGAQPWSDDGAPPLQLWNCPACNTTLTTNAIARASKGAGDGP